ncbi:MAG TPA: zinc ribbon domain-containing protein [Candidatus Desulfofervidus auxilii]|uniref:Zinc ribbon domain-containing protein n=1 Tax=Desulfofervidus auxilii TaxID=1621989 RepID=A0A7C0U160_DESA2|nr:zinc ribbon domain-containing protein [Candidatus Desulfofervidus auxilii]HDD43260.1 zinc ribbon domain-containing protein [Candidatus Desulfofervidus auxilii]
MPIYEYVCEDCGERFECLVFGNEKISCPKCKGENLKRLISGCNFSFGSGSTKSNTSISSSSSCATCSATS